MIIQEEDYLDCEEELVQLGALHYEEIKVLPFKYNPNTDLFRQMDSIGFVFVISMRDDYDNLIGYSLNTISPHLIFKDVMQSQCNLLYVSPEYRGASALRLIDETEKIAKQKGSDMHSWDVPVMNDFSPILDRKGYIKIESMHSKCLGG